MSGTRKKKSGGRPRKFAEPSRVITITLPERTLQQLKLIGADRARSIVKAVDLACPAPAKKNRLVEVVEALPGMSVVIVGPSNALKKVSFVEMLEVAPARYLLAIPSGTALESLEVAVIDLLEQAEKAGDPEREFLRQLRTCIGDFRRHRKFSKREILLVDNR